MILNMKKKYAYFTVSLALLIVKSAYALPANLTEDVYLTSYQSGADFPSTVNMELTNNSGVTINAFCNDHKYCNQYEAVLNKSSESELDLNHKKARVNLKLVSYDPENPVMKSYDLIKITYLKD